ncbi:hypothetical protein WJX74_005376 [Apatococcus lobatus]|uniref:Uncharacterized protein n=1 Tax=Apatococcus lobatus TaxID=904363 RepID=A0AAW1SB12_9CHLO
MAESSSRILVPRFKAPVYRPATASVPVEAVAHSTGAGQSSSFSGLEKPLQKPGYFNPERPATAPVDFPKSEYRRQNDGLFLGVGGRYVADYCRAKGPQLSDAHGAGLGTGGAFHGRVNPQLGPGRPALDNRQQERISHKSWHPQHSHLLQKRDIMGQNEYLGIPPVSGRLSKKTFVEPNAKKYHLNGAGVGVHQSDEGWHKSRGWGYRPRYATINTTDRIVGTRQGLIADDVDPCEGRRHNFAKKVHLNRGLESPDVLQYRYSKGICPDAYKLDSARMPAPPTSPRIDQLSQKSVSDARLQFHLNRARAEGITNIIN